MFWPTLQCEKDMLPSIRNYFTPDPKIPFSVFKNVPCRPNSGV